MENAELKALAKSLQDKTEKQAARQSRIYNVVQFELKQSSWKKGATEAQNRRVKNS